MKRTFALIIDDDRDTIEMHETLMHLEDYVTTSIDNGLEAINWLEVNDAPDVILLDVNIPQVDGRQIYEFIRRKSKFIKTRIVIVTANSYMAVKMEKMIHARDCILQKPFKMAQLQQIARRLRLQVIDSGKL